MIGNICLNVLYSKWEVIMKKRLLIIILALCLTLSLMPGLGISAGASGGWESYINCNAETFINLGEGTYTLGEGGPEISNGMQLQESWLGKIVYYVSDETSTPLFTIPTRPTAPRGFMCSPSGEYMAMVYGTSSDMEYRHYNESIYTSCPGEITSIFLLQETSARYYFRYKAVDGESLASNDAAVLVYTDIAGGGVLLPGTNKPKEEAPPEPDKGYTDVSPDKWYYGAVSYVKHTGLMPGRSADTFEPDAFTTREEVAAILYNIAGEEFYPSITNSFADIPEVADCLTAILWGVENEIVKGTSDSTFGFGESVTREHLAAFFYRLAGHLNYDTGNKGELSSYTDSSSVTLTEEMAWAIGDGIMNGVGDNRLSPQGTATRAQVAAMVQRFMKQVRPYF
jgi:hypothetical protein